MNLPHRFYPIVDRADWLERLLPQGVKLVQLRIKALSGIELREEVQRSVLLARQYQAALVVNDYWELAIDLGADWLHLGQEDLEQADVQAIRQAGIRLGISTHSEDELENALRYSPDYVALGPVFPTQTKQMPWQPQGAENVTRWKQRVGQIPLCAIGGITLERAPAIYAAGADLIAVVSDVTAADNPEQRTADWLSLAARLPAEVTHG